MYYCNWVHYGFRCIDCKSNKISYCNNFLYSIDKIIYQEIIIIIIKYHLKIEDHKLVQLLYTRTFWQDWQLLSLLNPRLAVTSYSIKEENIVSEDLPTNILTSLTLKSGSGILQNKRWHITCVILFIHFIHQHTSPQCRRKNKQVHKNLMIK